MHFFPGGREYLSIVDSLSRSIQSKLGAGVIVCGGEAELVSCNISHCGGGHHDCTPPHSAGAAHTLQCAHAPNQ